MAYNYQYCPIVEPPMTGIMRLPDNAHIPDNPDNKDWISFQSWLAQGNTPLPPD